MSFIALITPSAADGDHARPIRPVLARLADLDGRVEEGTASGSAARLHMTLESQDLRLQQPSGSEDQVGHDQQKARFDSLVSPHLSDAYALARSVTGNHSE